LWHPESTVCVLPRAAPALRETSCTEWGRAWGRWGLQLRPGSGPAFFSKAEKPEPRLLAPLLPLCLWVCLFFLKGGRSDFRDDRSEPRLPATVSSGLQRTGLNFSLTQAKYHQKGFLPLIKKTNQQRMSVICEILPFWFEIL